MIFGRFEMHVCFTVNRATSGASSTQTPQNRISEIWRLLDPPKLRFSHIFVDMAYNFLLTDSSQFNMSFQHSTGRTNTTKATKRISQSLRTWLDSGNILPNPNDVLGPPRSDEIARE